MTAPNATINRINATRATYGFAPVGGDDSKWVIEEDACDKVAECWVRMGRGVDEWKEACPEMVRLLSGDIEFRRGRIDLCGIADTWEEDYGLSAEDFARLDSNIQGWIVAHGRAYGRLR